MEVFTPAQRRELLGVTGPSAAALLEPEPGLTGLQLTDLRTYLPGDLLPKADLASMAHSLELRSPLLDRRVVELGLALPDRLKLKSREGKQALRRAFADKLPAEIAARGKSGFGVPLADWFRGDLHELAAAALGGSTLVDPAAARRLLDDHKAGRADHGHRLWCLVMLELWHEAHVVSTTP
ncbi:MAG: asparagine synthase-related protein, partial [Gaiellaceae bacterium]